MMMIEDSKGAETIGNDSFSDDGLSLWSRYSAQLNNEGINKPAAGKSPPSTIRDTVTDSFENFDHEALVYAYRQQLSVQDSIGPRNISSLNTVEIGDRSLDDRADACQFNSSQSKTTGRLEPHQLPTFPIRQSSLVPETASHRNGNTTQRASHLFGSKFSDDTHANMAHNDESFWAVTASLLGPDFDFNAHSIREQMKDLAMASIQRLPTSPLLSTSTSRPSSSRSPVNKVSQSSLIRPNDPAQTLPKASKIPPVLSHDVLPFLGQSWQWFTTPSSLQLYISTLQKSHDFGVCFLDRDGFRFCCIMRARGSKRSYSLPAPRYWATQNATSAFEFPDGGCEAVFWWCLPPSLSTDPDPALLLTVKELHRRYDTAKLLINTFKRNVMNAQTTQEELNIAYKGLLLDLPLREKLTGRFSFDAMNTVLLLGEFSEALGMVPEARRWNCELVSRRARRLGRKSEHTCQARYKLSALLLQIGEYEDARDVSRENLQCLEDMPSACALAVRQNIQSCMISMKRRRLDQAMEVVLHLWTAERWHKRDLRTRDQALGVLVEATLFRHQFVEAERWVRKRIELFDGQVQEMRSGCGDNRHRGDVYIQLANCLKGQVRLLAAAEAARTALKLYKESDWMQGYDESVCETYNLLGKLYFDMKEWNKSWFYLDKAAIGYTTTLTSQHEKSVKARELLDGLEKSMSIRQGLAERLVRHREKRSGKKTL